MRSRSPRRLQAQLQPGLDGRSRWASTRDRRTARPVDAESRGARKRRSEGARRADRRGGRAGAPARSAARERSIDVCVHTRFERTRRTAEIALEGREIPLSEGARLDDIDVGLLEGRTTAEYRAWKRAHSRRDLLPEGESRRCRRAICAGICRSGGHRGGRGARHLPRDPASLRAERGRGLRLPANLPSTTCRTLHPSCLTRSPRARRDGDRSDHLRAPGCVRSRGARGQTEGLTPRVTARRLKEARPPGLRAESLRLRGIGRRLWAETARLPPLVRLSSLSANQAEGE